MEERIKTALKFLKDKQTFKVGELRLGTKGKNIIEVTGWSQYTDYKNLTKQEALRELEEIKVLFYKMVAVSSELKTFLEDKIIQFNLYFDDYGKGSIGICFEKDNNLEWITNLDR